MVEREARDLDRSQFISRNNKGFEKNPMVAKTHITSGKRSRHMTSAVDENRGAMNLTNNVTAKDLARRNINNVSDTSAHSMDLLGQQR